MTLRVRNLSFSYGWRKKMLFRNFSLDVKMDGQVYGLLGKNGVGKSTLLQLMCGLLTPLGGEICLHGVNVRDRCPSILSDMFFIPEEFELPNLLLAQYVRLYAAFYPRFCMKDMLANLDSFDLDIHLNLGKLSMGQKKKVLISFALATHASIILMDEPTNGLDIPSKSQFRKMIASRGDEDSCVVISTHQVRDIERVLDHVLIMNEDGVLIDEPIQEITQKLLFVESGSRELAEKALYAMPSIQGNYLLLSNPDGEESDVNLELLFASAMAVPGKISELFHSKERKYEKE